MDSKKQQACRFKPTILIVMLNVNVISTPVKSWRYSECIEKADTKEKKKSRSSLYAAYKKGTSNCLTGTNLLRVRK